MIRSEDPDDKSEELGDISSEESERTKKRKEK